MCICRTETKSDMTTKKSHAADDGNSRSNKNHKTATHFYQRFGLLEIPEYVASFVESAHMQSPTVGIRVVDPSDAENPTVFLVNGDICLQETTRGSKYAGTVVSKVDPSNDGNYC